MGQLIKRDVCAVLSCELARQDHRSRRAPAGSEGRERPDDKLFLLLGDARVPALQTHADPVVYGVSGHIDA
jgi:hypothetical protein